MHKWIRHYARITRSFNTICALTLWMLVSPLGVAQDGPPQEVFMPKAERGPVVLVISGQSGTSQYRSYAKQVADLGYYTVLIDGKDILTRTQDGAQNLRSVISKAQASPNGAPEKVMVIGFSQGGGGVLAHGWTLLPRQRYGRRLAPNGRRSRSSSPPKVGDR